MVVIAIIGILAGVIVVNLLGSRAKGRDARRIHDMHQFQDALEAYQNDCGQYPPTLDATEASGCVPPVTFGDFMPVRPTDPQTGAEYVYNYDDVEDSFTLAFDLEKMINTWDAGSHTLEPDGIH